MAVAREFSVLGPLMGGFGSQAFLGCVHDDGGLKPAVFVFLPEEIVDDHQVFSRVWQETQLGNQIDHVNVIGVMGLARLDEGFARVVEYADAESLRSVYRRAQTLKRPLPPSMAVTIMADACLGVHYAHELGEEATGAPWVHGGIRPETLQVSFQGMTKVTGYGAQALSDVLRKNSAHSGLVARDTYTSPEQAFGGRAAATAQSDIYALGCVLFEALTGKPPIPSDTDLAEAMIKDELARPTLKGVTDAMVEVILKATQKRSRDRYPTALAMREDLQLLCGPADAGQLRAYLDELFPADVVPRATRMQMLRKAQQEPPATTGRLLLELPEQRSAPRNVRPATPSDVAVAAATGTRAGLREDPEATAKIGPGGQVVASWNAPTTQQSFAQAQSIPDAPAPSPSPSPSPARAPLPVTSPSGVPAPTIPTAPVRLSPALRSSMPEPNQPVVVEKSPAWLVGAVGLMGGLALAFGLVLWLKPDPAPLPASTPPVPVSVSPPAPPPAPTPPPVAPPVVEPPVAATVAPPEPKAPPKATGPGTVRVTSDPPLAISIDGKNVGTGTASVELPAGKHSVVGRDGNAKTTRTVMVCPGQTHDVALEIGRGTISVNGEAGVDVYVDGKKVGKTPLDPIPALEGTHKVIVKKGNTQYSHTVPVRSGTDSNFEFQLHTQ
jgi:eukaryotic-like serine/threonine-protein kinase